MLRGLTDLAENLDGQGFSIWCKTCPQYINVVFNGNSDGSTYKAYYNSTMQSNASEFVIGIKSVTSYEELPKAIFDGIKNAVKIGTNDDRGQSTETSASIAMLHDLRITQNPNDPTKYYIFKDSSTLEFYGKATYNSDGSVKENTMTLTTYHYEYVRREEEYNLLKIHHGTKANQATNFYLKDMHTKSLGTSDLIDEDGNFLVESDEDRYYALSYDKDKQAAWLETLTLAQNKTIDDISVTTKQNANVAIRVLDGAIEYALDESTRIGAYLQRLEYTDSNITIMGENVQSAESIIRDADMAKEMTEYTKANVLTQASQAMLAQANQNLSGVLSLLQ